ncbi:MAG: SDR family NAD(P)-dependent oxidoreductase [Patescibacteria group bacterium]
MKILVTGGAGFIGSHLVDKLVTEGHQVAVVDDLSSGSQENLNEKVDFLEIDISDQSKINDLLSKEKFEVIVHTAAQKNVRYSVDNPQFDAEINIVGSLNLLEAGRKAGLRKFIFLSTGGAIYGDTDDRPTPESHLPKPASPYGITKLAVENYLYYYQLQYQLPYVALRLSNVYGPRQDPKGEAGVVAIFYTKIKQGEQPIINGDGKQTRDYIYVSDVVEAVSLSLGDKALGIYNVGVSKETSVNQLFKEIVQSVGQEIPEKHGPALPGEQQTSCLDITKIKERLGYQPKVDLEAGLKQTKEWFYQNEG